MLGPPGLVILPDRTSKRQARPTFGAGRSERPCAEALAVDTRVGERRRRHCSSRKLEKVQSDETFELDGIIEEHP